MNKLISLTRVRRKLKKGDISVGSWIQIPDGSSAEIMGSSDYDWVAVDLEHGSISNGKLPNLFRALELGDTLPFARVIEPTERECKMALDAGAAGIILPNIKNATHLESAINFCKWPPKGTRGVGFSRANLFGQNFQDYFSLAHKPFIVAMIEHIDAANQIDSILSVEGLDAIFIGPYDLSASMNITGEFSSEQFKKIRVKMLKACKQHNIPCGIHQVDPDEKELNKRVKEGFTFIAYSLDSVFLEKNSTNPIK